MIDLAASLHEQRYCQSAEGCVKTRSDLTRYRRLLDELRPGVIVETGTFSGKSACWLAETSGAHVVTIDVNPLIDADTEQRMRKLDVELLFGSSTDPRIVSNVYRFVEEHAHEQSVMVVLDSWHGRDHVLAELNAYHTLVTSGSYLVVEDTIAHWCTWELQPEGPYNGSPHDAVRLFMHGRGEELFVVDDEIEDMLPTTQHPGGWLKRR